MRNTFGNALALCGLTQVAAAEVLGVSIQTVKNWSSDRRAPPEGVWVDLAERWKEIDEAANSVDHGIGADPKSWGHVGSAEAPKIASALALLRTINASQSRHK